MPIFEYRCLDCSKEFAKLIGVTADSSDAACPSCGGERVYKLVSSFSRVRSRDEIISGYEDSAFAGDLDDPKGVSKLVKEMGKEISEDSGEEFDEYLEDAEKEICDCEGIA